MDKEKHRKIATDIIGELSNALHMPENDRLEKYGTHTLIYLLAKLHDEVNILANS